MNARLLLPAVLVALSAGALHLQELNSPVREPLSKFILQMSDSGRLSQLDIRLNQGLRDIQWAGDPIASRIDRQRAGSARDDIFRIATEARETQPRE